MLISELKAEVAAYLQRQVSDYVVNGVDLVLSAINGAHQYALQQYDFEYAKVSVDAQISLQNGVEISPLPLHGTTTLVTVKKVLRGWLADGFGGSRPLKFINRDYQAEDVAQRWAGIPVPFAPSQRDMPTYPYFFELYLTQQGSKLYLYPSSIKVTQTDPVAVALDVVRYFPDYKDSDENSDFLLQFGSDFLQWSSVCQLNTFSKEFVPRQEGNVGPPTDLLEQAWKDLLAWDAQLITTGDTAVNLD
jgi:hypothetical protein